MRINHNIPAMRTLHELGKVDGKLTKSMERLSSGLRINSAADDAAGMAIANKMDAQIRGLRQANRNAMDGISMIQTAEGATNEVHAILQRMRELSVQASNGTYSDDDLNKIQQEINQLTEEINRIGETTEFNTKPLLKGPDDKTDLFTDDIKFVDGVGAIPEEKSTVSIEIGSLYSDADLNALNGKTFEIKVDGVVTMGINLWDPRLGGAEPPNAINLAALTHADGNYASSLTDAIAGKLNESGLVAEANGDRINITSDLVGTTGNNQSISFNDNEISFSGGLDAVEQINANAELTLPSGMTLEDLKALDGKMITIQPQGIEIAFYDGSNPDSRKQGIDISNLIPGDGESYEDVLGQSIASHLETSELEATYANGKLTISNDSINAGEMNLVNGGGKETKSVVLQVGANEGQTMVVEMGDMRASALGLTGKPGDAGYTAEATVSDGVSLEPSQATLSVGTQESASNAITVIDKAISNVSEQRSKLGAVQNRLEHTVNNLGASEQNLTASMSRIQDADMAHEMSQYTQQNVISQAAMSMLAQANQRPQQVLQLLQR